MARERDNRATHVREYTGWALNNWQQAQNLFRPMQSLDQPIYPDNPTPLGETLPEAGNTEAEAIANADFGLLLEGLTPRQQTVLRMRFGEDLYISEIAQIMQLDISTVRHHEQDGLDKIRAKFGLPTKEKAYTDPQHRRDYQKNWYREKVARRQAERTE